MKMLVFSRKYCFIVNKCFELIELPTVRAQQQRTILFVAVFNTFNRECILHRSYLNLASFTSICVIIVAFIALIIHTSCKILHFWF